MSDDSDAYEAGEASERAADRTWDRDLRTHYLGVLGLLARCSVGLRDTDEESADELRDCIEQALCDAEQIVPIKWRRILDRIEVEIKE